MMISYKPPNDEYGVIEIGLGGVSATYSAPNHAGRTCSMSDNRLSAYYGELADGGFVLDKSGPLSANTRLAFHAPMHRPDCADYQRFVIPDDDIFARMVAFDRSAGSLGAAAGAAIADQRVERNADQPGPFDTVSTARYLAWWRERGARIGQRVGDSIQWEDGESEAIRQESERWAC